MYFRLWFVRATDVGACFHLLYLSLGGYLLLLVLVVRGLGRAFLCLSVGLSAVSSFVPRHRVRASGPLQLRRVA